MLVCISPAPDAPGNSRELFSDLSSTDCSNLWLDYYVCVHVAGATTTSPGEPEPTSGGPSPQMPGLDANCDNFHKIASGDQCDVIETKYGISDNQFKSWNSEINAGMYPPYT